MQQTCGLVGAVIVSLITHSEGDLRMRGWGMTCDWQVFVSLGAALAFCKAASGSEIPPCSLEALWPACRSTGRISGRHQLTLWGVLVVIQLQVSGWDNGIRRPQSDGKKRTSGFTNIQRVSLKCNDDDDDDRQQLHTQFNYFWAHTKHLEKRKKRKEKNNHSLFVFI